MASERRSASLPSTQSIALAASNDRASTACCAGVPSAVGGSAQSHLLPAASKLRKAMRTFAMFTAATRRARLCTFRPFGAGRIRAPIDTKGSGNQAEAGHLSRRNTGVLGVPSRPDLRAR